MITWCNNNLSPILADISAATSTIFVDLEVSGKCDGDFEPFVLYVSFDMENWFAIGQTVEGAIHREKSPMYKTLLALQSKTLQYASPILDPKVIKACFGLDMPESHAGKGFMQTLFN